MAKLSTNSFYTASLVIIALYTAFCDATVQYCHEDTRIPVRFCMATETAFNTSTSKTDLRLTFGYQRSKYGGWSAVGIGSEMVGAIAFVCYMEHTSGDYGLGRISGHWEPRPSPGTLPQIETTRAELNTSGWFEASVVCCGCNDWPTLDTTSSTQPWIWSTNTIQKFRGADIGAPLEGHTYFGHFNMDMTKAVSETGSTSSPVINGWESVGQAAPDPNSAPEDNNQSFKFLFRFHGTITSLAFTILYPCGALAIRSKFKNPFRTHVTIQLLTTTLIVVGVSTALYRLGTQGSIGDYLSQPHVILGTSLVLLVPIQVLLGHLHHQAFIASRRVPMVTKSHTAIGYSIMIGGCVNTWLGFKLAGSTWRIVVLCLILSLWNASVIFVPLYKSRRNQKGPRDKKLGDGESEDSVPFLRVENKQNSSGDD
ncbi:hypothetical protein QBC34DRAFT_364586 [Podospora aff. communis PSN243]|uniref:Cytochrome b561 domain-containing protein n=1 Tax=Podospora aff. communis PSN243 TaxID=3040156 RepID=A0AAV9FZW5_9PEZI|nr:hypothetical protein QBC34DRAFT_364586 [Podospora aff. communis PSN243]